MACGRRWGKTATGILAALRGHGAYRGQFKGAIDGGRIWWVAPSYPTLVASNAWNDLKRACQDAWVDKREDERTIFLSSGGSIAVRSADNPDSLRGPGLDGVVIDEAAFLSVDTWENSLRPALTDREGWAMLLSTPNGHNWFYGLFKRAADREGWQRWQEPTGNNPLITADELADAREDMGPLKFAQEHLAQFQKIEGAIFPVEYFIDTETGDETIWADEWPDAFEACVVAVDPSLGNNEKSDYSAIVFLGLSGGKLYVDADIERRPPTQIVADAYAMATRYQPADAVGFEHDGFQAVLNDLCDAYTREAQVAPLPLMTIGAEGKSKIARVQRLDPYFARHEVFFHPMGSGCRLLLEQLMFFPDESYKRDGPDALEMAVRLMRHLVEVEA